ncbi:MAG: FAD-dependent oxidoreductase [Anaerolineae bacterium]|nr:FAD-dependent oxidoreductase [Anaerolineae bacterium]
MKQVAVAGKYGGSDPVGERRPYTAIKQGAQFPYRAMLPLRIDGLLVAGRCASATMLRHYGGKNMVNTIAIGQAAGVAAALCAQTAPPPRDLDYHADYGPSGSGTLDYPTYIRYLGMYTQVPYFVLEVYQNREELLSARDIVRRSMAPTTR